MPAAKTCSTRLGRTDPVRSVGSTVRTLTTKLMKFFLLTLSVGAAAARNMEAPRMAGHVPIDPAIEYASRRGAATAAPAGYNGTGSAWWPLTPGTCIDYDVYAVTLSWNNATNELGIVSRGAKEAPQRICAYTRACSALGYGAMPMEQYEQPAGTARGFLTEGVSVDAQGVASIGESGNNFAAYAGSFLGKLPAGTPQVGQYLHSVTTVYPQSVCAGSKPPPITTNDWWSLRVNSMGKWGAWDDTTRTGLLESVYGRYNYVFAKGKGMVNFWYYGVTTMDPNSFLSCTESCPGFEYYATSYPTDKSPATGEPPFWASYP